MTSGRSLTSDATAGATMVETVAGLTIVGCALPSWAERALLLVKTSHLVAEATASAGFNSIFGFFMFCSTSKPIIFKGVFNSFYPFKAWLSRRATISIYAPRCIDFYMCDTK